MVLLTRGLQRQPRSLQRVNRQHPLARDMAYCMLPLGRGVVNAAADELAYKEAEAFAFPVVTSDDAALDCVPDYTTAIYVDNGTGAQWNLDGELTIMALVTPDGANASPYGQNAFSSGKGDGSTGQGSLSIKAFKISSGWGSSVVLDGATTLADGQRIMIGMTRGGSSGAWTGKLFLNGRVDATSTGITGNPGAQQYLAVGCYGNAVSITFALQFDGRIHGAWLWKRALSEAEVASFSANPWQIFSAPRRLWVPQVGGPTGLALEESYWLDLEQQTSPAFVEVW